MLRASQDAGAEDWRGWNSSQCRSLGTFGEGFDFILASNFTLAKLLIIQTSGGTPSNQI